MKVIQDADYEALTNLLKENSLGSIVSWLEEKTRTIPDRNFEGVQLTIDGWSE